MQLRLESHGLLARELLLALRRGLPLDGALDAFGIPEHRVPRWVWNTLILSVIFVILILAGWLGPAGAILGAIGLVILPTIFLGTSSQSGDYRRYVAMTLSKEIRRGKTLGEAFRAHTEIFDSYETTLIEAGERANRLDVSLEALSRHSQALDAFHRTASMFFYPMLLLLFFLSFSSMAVWRISPKFQDILCQIYGFDALENLENYWLYLIAIRFGPSFVNLMCTLLVAIVILSILPRLFFVGSSTATLLFMMVMTVAVLGLQIPIIKRLSDFCDAIGLDSEIAVWTAAGLAIPFSLVLALGVFRLMRFLSGRGMEYLMRAFSFLPYMRGADALLRESRFLSALNALLDAGERWPEALRAAGRATGGRRWLRTSEKAAEMAAQGRSPAEIFRAMPVLQTRTRSMLAIADFNGELLPTLGTIADSDHRIGQHLLTRFSCICVPLFHLLIGMMMALFILGFYQPIFAIPLLAGQY